MARNCTGNPKRIDKMDMKPPPPFNSQPPPPFNSSWAQNRPNYDQRGAYSYNGPPAQDFGPKLEKSNTLASANGQPLVEKGKAVFNLELGNLSLAKELVVAEIEDEVLLGLDILMKGEMGPADIKLTEGVILLNGVTIPCIQIGQPEPVRKVRAADNFTIPPQSEILIDVFVDKTENDPISPTQDYLIEPSSHFIENHPVMMASSLVDLCHDVTNKVRLISPFDQEVQINQDTVVGLAEKVEDQPILLFSSENIKDSTNFDSVRRIKLESDPVTWQTNEGIIRNITKKGRSEKEQEAIANLLHKYATAFSAHETDLGLTHLTEHSIDTGDARPIKQAPRRVPLAFAEEERKIITQMLDQGVIENSSSPWASPLLLIRKKNGKIRPAVDYRKINSKTVCDVYPLPRIQDCLDAVSGANLFSVFDLISGFHQIPVKLENRPKTVFTTKYGLYEFKTMPFGHRNNGLSKDEGEFYLDTDASDIAIGAVLSQMQDGQLKVISYGSRTINKREKLLRNGQGAVSCPTFC
ncbi:unnamed protein product [Mytilus coruscus]|uniref:Uncharacterized protein n=1 Tax=Mytilus coruscus TaxID=42192 RepID=A0A6J8EQM2_MYTCO|nr:unnamed protein product [Mytilus coruscus]